MLEGGGRGLPDMVGEEEFHRLSLVVQIQHLLLKRERTPRRRGRGALSRSVTFTQPINVPSSRKPIHLLEQA